MSDIANVLRDCHQMVWKYRQELEPYWKIPSTRDCARFAVCEACESLDSMLRLNKAYARNNAKDLSVEAELSDTLMMLLTAIGKNADVRWELKKYVAATWLESRMDAEEAKEAIDHIVTQTATVLKFCDVRGYDRTWRVLAWSVCSDIALYVGPTVTEQLRGRLERIRLKRMPPPQVTVEDAYVALVRRGGS